MRLTRIIAGAASASLLGLVPLTLTAAPANAADYTTVTTLKASRGLIEFKQGYSPFISGAVTKPDGGGVYYGTVDLMAKPAGAKWRKISTKDASGYVSFSEVIPKQNTQYRLVYNGGASSYDTFAASSSGTMKIKVARKLTVKSKSGRRVKVSGKVAPKYAKKKIVIHKKVGKKWKKFRTIKTNKKSRFSITMPAASKKPVTFRFRVPGNKKYAQAQYIGTLRRI